VGVCADFGLDPSGELAAVVSDGKVVSSIYSDSGKKRGASIKLLGNCGVTVAQADGSELWKSPERPMEKKEQREEPVREAKGESCPPDAPGPCGAVEGGVRLADCQKHMSYEGVDCCRVEVYHDKEWGTVCDDGVSKKFVKTVCKQLGKPFDRALEAAGQGNGDSGMIPGKGRIWLTEVQCKNIEDRIADCDLGPESLSWGGLNKW